MERPGVMRALKLATADRHARLEALVAIEQRLRSRADYADLLCDLHAFHAGLEPALHATPGLAAALPDHEQRRKLGALAADLAALGVRPAAPHPTAVPTDDLADALGVLYVLEGATLGGAQITRLAHRALGVTPHHGCAFFSSYGEQRGAMWRAFSAAAERHATARSPAAACATFDALAGHLVPLAAAA